MTALYGLGFFDSALLMMFMMMMVIVGGIVLLYKAASASGQGGNIASGLAKGAGSAIFNAAVRRL